MTRRKGRRGNSRGGSTVLVVLVVVTLALCVGCGKKGGPRAPELAIPERINDLRAAAGKEGISLTWTRPSQYVDGQNLTDLGGFALFRKENVADCLECQVPYRERIVINVEDQDKFIKKTKYTFRDQDLKEKSVYRYRIFSRLFDGSLSQPSNEVIVEWMP